ncbi:ketopantoate reductase family protein [Desulfosarcina sp.]|uniref:ketopantoate reductase family protein n=1 Tax=Desulfosarcina sp. TaxID=2027861 RepID=UPI00397102B4
MDSYGLKVALLGAGAIGGVTGARMSKAGWDVQVVCKHPEAVALSKDPGFHIFGIGGESDIPVRAVATADELQGPLDVVFLATKAGEAIAAAESLLPFLKPEASVVSLQNGICEEALARVVGEDRIVGCVVAWGATFHGPGRMEVTSEGHFVVGRLDSSVDARLETIREMLSAVAPTRISTNIIGELYSKLIINSCINSLGVIAGVPLGQLLAVRKIRELFIAIMSEAMAVADAMNLTVPPGGGKLDYGSFLKKKGWLGELRRHLTIRIIGYKYRRIRSSSLQSLERGRRTEIDYLNGYICQQGRRRHIPTPINDAVVAMIHEIEDGNRSISMANLDDLGDMI